MNDPQKDPAIQELILTLQRGEITEHFIYQKIGELATSGVAVEWSVAEQQAKNLRLRGPCGLVGRSYVR
jgi:hypothetical protein